MFDPHDVVHEGNGSDGQHTGGANEEANDSANESPQTEQVLAVIPVVKRESSKKPSIDR